MPLFPSDEYDLFKAISRIEIDRLQEHSSIKYKKTRFVNLSVNDFINNLYEPPSNEDEIRRMLFRSDELTCVIGPKGCGKSTILKKLLVKNIPKNHGYLWIDFEKEAEILPDLSVGLNKLKENLIIDIKEKIRAFFYEGGDNNDNEKYRKELTQLAKILLTLDPKKNKNEALHRGMPDLREGIRTIMVKNEFNGTLNNIIWKNNYAEVEVYIINKVIPQISIIQLIWGLIEFDRFEKFYLVFDNVDRLPNEFQPFYLEIANDIQQSILNISKCIIAIRRENIHRTKAVTNASQANNINLAYVSKDKRIHQIKRYKSIDIRIEKENQLKNILLKRVNYAKEHMDKLVEKNVDHNTRLNLFIKLNNMITDTYLEEKFYNLTNGSYRIMLEANLNFIEYIIDNENINVSSIINEKNRKKAIQELTSIFYSWLMKVGDDFHIHVYNPVILYYNRNPDELGCFLEHLILAFLFNAEQKYINDRNKIYNYTLIKELFNPLEELGFKRVKIKETLYNLYHFNDLYGNLIELKKSGLSINNLDPIKSYEEINLDDLTWINPSGHESVLSTTHKFIFMLEGLACIYGEDCVNNNISSIEKQCFQLLQFNQELINYHLSALENIRNRYLGQGKRNWFEFYKKNFSINSHLQAEMIIYNHIGYLIQNGREDLTFYFEKLKERYNKEIRNIVNKGKFNRIKRSRKPFMENIN